MQFFQTTEALGLGNLIPLIGILATAYIIWKLKERKPELTVKSVVYPAVILGILAYVVPLLPSIGIFGILIDIAIVVLVSYLVSLALYDAILSK